MPDPYDTAEIARRLAAGESLTDIAHALDGPGPEPGSSPEAIEAARARSNLLTGQAGQAGTLPEADPVEAALKAGHAAGSRGGDKAMQAYVSTIFSAAQAGDERVAHKGVVDTPTRETWLNAAHDRQVRNRDQTHPVR